MSKEFSITREIGIDMAHRVTHHGSKCRNLHGHRYTILATCVGQLFDSGEQEGMVLDFGFLKDEMMRVIDAEHDHGTTLWYKDPFAKLFLDDEHVFVIHSRDQRVLITDPAISHVGKICLVGFVPTAENLAQYWFMRLAPRIIERSEGHARLKLVKVFETPNCSAEYGE